MRRRGHPYVMRTLAALQPWARVFPGDVDELMLCMAVAWHLQPRPRHPGQLEMFPDWTGAAAEDGAGR